MPELSICDTSCLILFEKIDQLKLLRKCYGTIYVTPKVAEEFGKALPDWIELKNATNLAVLQTLEQILDAGEASAIALCVEYPQATIVLDDLKGRKIAKSLNLKVTGSLGILIKAKQTGKLEKLKPVIEQIQKTDFRISENIVKKALELVGE